MNKNLSRDVNLLKKICSYQVKILNCLRDFNCNLTEDDGALYKNEYALGYCSLYLIQFYEAYKNLTDSSAEYIKCHIDINGIKYYRNMASHTYEIIDKQVLQNYIFSLVNDNSVNAVKSRYSYCINTRKTSS